MVDSADGYAFEDTLRATRVVLVYLLIYNALYPTRTAGQPIRGNCFLLSAGLTQYGTCARTRKKLSFFIFQFPRATPVLPLSAFLEFLDDSTVYYLAVVHCSAHVLVPQQLLHSRYAYAL